MQAEAPEGSSVEEWEDNAMFLDSEVAVDPSFLDLVGHGELDDGQLALAISSVLVPSPARALAAVPMHVVERAHQATLQHQSGGVLWSHIPSPVLVSLYPVRLWLHW